MLTAYTFFYTRFELFIMYSASQRFHPRPVEITLGTRTKSSLKRLLQFMDYLTLKSFFDYSQGFLRLARPKNKLSKLNNISIYRYISSQDSKLFLHTLILSSQPSILNLTHIKWLSKLHNMNIVVYLLISHHPFIRLLSPKLSDF